MLRRVVIAIVLACVLGLLWISRFGSASVCKKCGRTRFGTDFQLPLLPVTYWRRQSIEQTLLSETARDLGFVVAHSHEWELIQGGGNGIMCALGHGGELLPTMRSPVFSKFLVCTERYRGSDEAYNWIQLALDYRTSRAVYDWILLKSFPSDGFSTIDGYDNWRRHSDPEWPETLQHQLNRWPDSTSPPKTGSPNR